MDDRIKTAGMLERIAKRIVVAINEEGDGGGFQNMIDTENDLQEELDRAEKAGKKYILVNKFKGYWHIMACRDFTISTKNGGNREIRKGDEGGFIGSEKNLSHDGSCWVDDMSLVYGNATVTDNAYIFGHAQVYGDARIHGGAAVCGRAHVCGKAEVYGDALVADDATVYGDAHVHDATVQKGAKVYGDADVSNVVLGDGDIISHGKIDKQPPKNQWYRDMTSKAEKITRKLAMSREMRMME